MKSNKDQAQDTNYRVAKFCQGDLMFVLLNTSRAEKGMNFFTRDFGPDDEVIDGKFVVERGERTGHAHVMNAEDINLGELFGGDVIVVNKPTVVTHEQLEGKTSPLDKLHEPLLLEKGVYQVLRQRQMTYPVQESTPRAKFD